MGVGESAADEEHAEAVVVAVPESSGNAAVKFDESAHSLGAAVVRPIGVHVGLERRGTARRPWLCATTPHQEQPTGPAGDSMTARKTAACSLTSTTWSPFLPTSSLRREH